jgi:hypothetical protein
MKKKITFAMAAVAVVSSALFALDCVDISTRENVSLSQSCPTNKLDVVGIGMQAPRYEIQVNSPQKNDMVMTVNGLHVDGNWQRPKSTNDVAVEIWTSDGRRWRAKWQEVQ